MAYSPRGQSILSKQSKGIISPIKNAKAGYIPDIVKRLSLEMSAGKSAAALGEVLGPDVLVVPCPRSSLLVQGALWPAKEICAALVSHNLAAGAAMNAEESARKAVQCRTTPSKISIHKVLCDEIRELLKNKGEEK